MRVLILEDDRIFAEALRDVLSFRSEVRDIDLAFTIADARSLLGRTRYDLCISDCHFPDGWAYELFEEINPECPILVISGHAGQTECRALSVRLGVPVRLLPKPALLSEILEAIDSLTVAASRNG